MKSIYLWLLAISTFLLYFNLSAQPKDNSLTMEVNGVCGMCKKRIEDAAIHTKGVKTADWNVSTKQLQVSFHPKNFNEDQLHQNLASVGHDTEKVKASDEVYNNLHGCCKYRSEAVIESHKEEASNSNNSTIHIELGELKGKVYAADENENLQPLYSANVYWANTIIGTTTDENGQFYLPKTSETNWLVVSFVGLGSDTLNMEGLSNVQIELENSLTLEEIEVAYRKKTTEVSFLNPIKTQQIGEGELLKAACCNLSESFETNPSVDVSFTDAVTGTRQIQMLGLAGPYVQIGRENMPNIRGLAALYGFTYTPGHWIEGIQLNKGTGSVVNGFESIAGQINVELKKPQNSEKVYLNLYANEGGRLEANANFSHRLSDKWQTGLLLHGKYQQAKFDKNEDGFLDNPTGNQFIAINRWKFTGKNGLEGQFGVKATLVDNTSGQEIFDGGNKRIGIGLWRANIETNRFEGWLKMGKVFPKKPFSSFGSQFSVVHHDQKAYFGLRNYDATQKSLYANLIYQSIFDNTNHQFKTGVSFQYDKFDENVESTQYERNEAVPGAYFEYTYTQSEKFSAVVGLRGDYHNNYGFFATPRMHLRYAPTEKTVLRASMGRGQKTANIFAENIGVFASNRSIIIDHQNTDLPYGLDAEVAWNFGLNLTQEITLGEKTASLGLDYYRTHFVNQIIADYEQSPQELHLYNLDGKSYSNSLQAQVDMEILPRLDVRLAYRLNDVKMTFDGNLLQKPLTSKHRAFINLGYHTESEWKFDFTLNWQGEKRIPSTVSNPEPYRLETYSPAFFTANTQVTKSWAERFEVYVGAENLFHFRQENPIIASSDPFGEYFDSSLVWGPIFGRMVYGGLRYRLK
ncbi:MAG: TonB-dependent receptor [Chitinophagales bacterium]